jgi:hypothetical protein
LKKVLATHNAILSPNPKVTTYINASTQSPILILFIHLLVLLGVRGGKPPPSKIIKSLRKYTGRNGNNSLYPI